MLCSISTEYVLTLLCLDLIRHKHHRVSPLSCTHSRARVGAVSVLPQHLGHLHHWRPLGRIQASHPVDQVMAARCEEGDGWSL